MVFLSTAELIDIVLMSLIVGFIFKDAFKPRVRNFTPEDWLKNVTPGRIAGNDFWFAVALVAPSIIFHEFGHKFVAMAYGLSATFNAAYGWLLIGVVLKLVMPGLLFFVPAYVSVIGVATPFQHALIAFAGPGVNLIFWLGSKFLLENKKDLKREHIRFLTPFRQINMFLFFFNMLPISPFDGYTVFTGLFQAIF